MHNNTIFPFLHFLLIYLFKWHTLFCAGNFVPLNCRKNKLNAFFQQQKKTLRPPYERLCIPEVFFTYLEKYLTCYTHKSRKVAQSYPNLRYPFRHQFSTGRPKIFSEVVIGQPWITSEWRHVSPISTKNKHRRKTLPWAHFFPASFSFLLSEEVEKAALQPVVTLPFLPILIEENWTSWKNAPMEVLHCYIGFFNFWSLNISNIFDVFSFYKIFTCIIFWLNVEWRWLINVCTKLKADIFQIDWGMTSKTPCLAMNERARKR